MATSPICGRPWRRRCNIIANRWTISRISLSLSRIAARVAEFRDKLAKLPGKKVGVCWRSMMLGAKRAKYFSAIDGWVPLLKTPGVSFVNLQYGDCAEEIAQRRRAMAWSCIRWKAWICATISTARPPCRLRSIWFCRRPPRRPRPPPASARKSGSSPPAAPGRNWARTNIPGTPRRACCRRERFGDWASLMPRAAAELAVFAAR